MTAERRRGSKRRDGRPGEAVRSWDDEQIEQVLRREGFMDEPFAASPALEAPGVPPRLHDDAEVLQRSHRTTASRSAPFPPPSIDSSRLKQLIDGAEGDPHSILGAHPATVQGTPGVVVRAMQPDAIHAECLPETGSAVEMERQAPGIFSAFLAGATFPLKYRLRFRFSDDSTWERDDPYRFPPTIGEMDLHLFNEGTHRRLWDRLGAHPIERDGITGTAFAVWAPNARRVSVVGDFNNWDGRAFPMRSMGASGVWELFLPAVEPGALYKYELLTREGGLRLKTDPFAFKMEQYPGNASIVVATGAYTWGDAEWMSARTHIDPARAPMLVYEVHLGSWARVPGDGDRPLTYAEIVPRLVEHARRLGVTHVELLPVAEHPFTGSWGYQVSGYYAPTSRYGTADDFRYFVDCCHRAGIGVILDWVPAHFPKDDYALRRFDGTALYEHEDPRLGEHPDWGTLIFNYGRPEVRNFLIANALYWMDEFHIDGLRVDAVASMLYLDYSRKPDQWLRNRFGGRENLEAISFLRELNETIRAEEPGAMMIAEESTAWPGVTKPVSEGGLGFYFKWNMGWMHDTLQYFSQDPIHRRYHQDQLTFAMMYEYSERFIMPLSHDEVVHMKRSLLEKMPGDDWQKFANMRALLGYQYTRPGKKLFFMGTEIGATEEWNHDRSLPWHLTGQPMHAGLSRFLEDLGRIYREHSALWRLDHDPAGFSWIDLQDRDASVLSYVRRDGDDVIVVVLNMTPVPRHDYRIGVPTAGAFRQILSSDDAQYGGSGMWTPLRVEADGHPWHGFEQSMVLQLPPLAILVLAPIRDTASDHSAA